MLNELSGCGCALLVMAIGVAITCAGLVKLWEML